MENPSPTANPPPTLRQRFKLGVTLLKASRWAEAERVYRSMLAEIEGIPEVHVNLATALRGQAKTDEAIAACQRALALRPQFPEAWQCLGEVYRTALRLEEAINAYRNAVAQRHAFPEAWHILGTILRATGQPAEAIDAYRQAITLQPNFPEAWNNLANALGDQNKREEAIDAYRHALALRPKYAEAWCNLGNDLRKTKCLPEAIEAFQRSIAIRADDPEAWNGLGDAFRETRQYEQAMIALQRGLAIRSEFPEAWNNLGNTLREQGRYVEAITCFRKALEFRENFPEAWNDLGAALCDHANPGEAIGAYRRALDLAPDTAMVWCNLAGAYKDNVQIDDALAGYEKGITLDPAEPAILGSRICAVQYHSDFDPIAIYQEACRWNERFARPLGRNQPPHDNDPSPQRRLRIGYSSGDFRKHCAAMFIVPLLAHHDHANFEIVCYSNVKAVDAVTATLRSHADLWRDVAGTKDQDMADLIRQDRIDILVDLSLHTAGHRLLVFARKPAPVQVTWLGYPGTTGLDVMDYRLTDARLDPPTEKGPEIRNPKPDPGAPGRINEQNPNDQNPNDSSSPGAAKRPEALPHSEIGKLGFDSDFGFRISDFSTKEPYYSERSLRLPDSFWCYDPLALGDSNLPEPGPLPALLTGHVTFGCLNSACKASRPTLELWGRVLAAVPGSKLMMVAPPGSSRQRALENLGVTNAGRVEFLAFQPRSQYYQTYRLMDLFLDTLPFNGGTTSLDSLWMGVPILTLAGRTVVGRAGWSHLHNLELADQLVAHTPEEYVAKAVAWAGDLPRLAALRAELRPRMQRSPLMDAPRFARNVEAAYRNMWKAWCAGHK